MTTRILRYPDVQRVTGLSRKTIERRLETGNFPVPVKLGSRAVGFLSDEVEAWIRDQPRVTPNASNNSQPAA